MCPLVTARGPCVGSHARMHVRARMHARRYRRHARCYTRTTVVHRVRFYFEGESLLYGTLMLHRTTQPRHACRAFAERLECCCTDPWGDMKTATGVTCSKLVPHKFPLPSSVRFCCVHITYEALQNKDTLHSEGLQNKDTLHMKHYRIRTLCI